jgi:regulator of replication initiation timing
MNQLNKEQQARIEEFENIFDIQRHSHTVSIRDINDLNKKNDHLRYSNGRLTQENEKLQARVHELEQELEESQKNKMCHPPRLIDMIGEFADDHKKHGFRFVLNQSEAKEILDYIADLNKNINSMHKRLTEANAEIVTLKEQIQLFTAENEHLIKDHAVHVRSLRKQIADLHKSSLKENN